MSPLNLRPMFAQLQAMPRYLPFSNGISSMRAQQIARMFRDDLSFLAAEFAQANIYGAELHTRADTAGQGAGMYPNAEALFMGYVYEMHREGQVDGMQAARHEQFDN